MRESDQLKMLGRLEASTATEGRPKSVKAIYHDGERLYSEHSAAAEAALLLT